MERYGCLIVGVIVALVVLVGIVYLWSGWLNRPVGRAPAAPIQVAQTFLSVPKRPIFVNHAPFMAKSRPIAPHNHPNPHQKLPVQTPPPLGDTSPLP